MDFVINDLELEKSFTFKIHPDLTVKKESYYCVMQNPFNKNYDTKIINGSSIRTVQNKIRRRYKNLKMKEKR